MASCRASSSSRAWVKRPPVRNSGSPDWRVPKNSPGPRIPRSTSARRNPSCVSAIASMPLPGLVGHGLVHQQDAVGPRGAATHPTPELVELGQAEPLGVLDQHHRGVGHVDPDLDHGGRHEEVDLPGLERPHHRVLGVERQAPVDEPDAEVAEGPGLEPLGHLGRRLEVARLRLLDQGAHDVGLAPGPELVADEVVDPSRARPRRASSVRMGVRPGGSSSSTETSRSP